ncbi:MAG: hypothetical protein N2Z72_03875 [Bacteroidales bacterium]|nr:hypothetical protein [Bacteroidales bacterium]
MRFKFVLILFAIGLKAQEVPKIWVDTSYHLINEPFHFDSLNISLIPPAYFQPFFTEKQVGFIHRGSGSTIEIKIIPDVLYPYVVKGMTKEALSNQQVVLKDHTELLTNEGKPADLFLLGFTLKSGDYTMEFERLMLITGDLKKTVIVIANYPIVAKKVLFHVLKESLLTVNF